KIKKTRQNNYYPFGLKHEGYNDLPSDGYKYKLLNREYEDSFGLNVTETDYRQYDAALGRFNVMDMMSEMAPDHTPYRYGFNNPVYFSDATGLFESYGAAQQWIDTWGLSNATIRYNWNKSHYEIENDGVSFYQQGEDIISTMYSWSDSGGMTISYSTIKGGAASGNSNNGFWKFMETGGGVNAWGVMRDMPGFKMNSRKRSAVDFSINYDEFYSRSAGGSVRFGKNFWKRLYEYLGGMDSRSSSLWESLNQIETETKDSEVNSMDSLYPQETRWFGIGVVVYPKIDSNRVNISPNSERGQ